MSEANPNDKGGSGGNGKSLPPKAKDAAGPRPGDRAGEGPPEAPPPGGIELAPGVRVPESGLRLQYSRSGGPGGQNVNKVNSKCELWVAVGPIMGLTAEAKARLRALAGRRLTQGDEIHIAAETSRNQEMNRADAFERLKQLIVSAAHVPKARRKTRPSAGARRRRLESKKKRGQTKSNRRPGAGDW